MLKISEAVKDIVSSSEIPLTALAKGYLNLSAYAKSIKGEVEEKAKKPVRTGSIIIALSRLKKSLKVLPPLLPEVTIEDLSVKSGLVEIAFDKTKKHLDRLSKLYTDKDFKATEFFTVTQGTGDISIIALERARPHILRIFKSLKPKAAIPNLVSITIRFSESYIKVPNVIYKVLRMLAVKRINVVELVSSYTELTFILEQCNLQEAFLTLNEMFQKSEKSDYLD